MKPTPATLPEAIRQLIATKAILKNLPLYCRHCGALCADGLEEMPCQRCGVETLFRFIPQGMPRNYKEIKKFLGLKDGEIAGYFGMKDAQSWSSSRGRLQNKTTVENIFFKTIFTIIEL